MANSHPDQPIIAQLEVIRVGHDDMADAELAEVAAAIERDPRLRERLSRIQRVDAQFAIAFRSVSVPTDSKQWVLERLAAAENFESNEADSGQIVSVASETTVSEPTRSELGLKRRFSSYRLLWTGVAAIAASLAVAVFLLPQSTPEETIRPDKLLSDAVVFYNSESGEPGTLISEKSPPADFAASSDVRHVASARWREVADFLGAPAVAYDLVGPHGEQATLYVTHRRLEKLELFTMPSPEALLSTGGMSATCWQNDDLLYVLVVAGDREQYDAFIRQPGTTIAIALPSPARLANVSARFA